MHMADAWISGVSNSKDAEHPMMTRKSNSTSVLPRMKSRYSYHVNKTKAKIVESNQEMDRDEPPQYSPMFPPLNLV